MSEETLKLILARDAANDLQMWACRGVGRGCERNKYSWAKPCDDCFGPLPRQMTLEEVAARLGAYRSSTWHETAVRLATEIEREAENIFDRINQPETETFAFREKIARLRRLLEDTLP
jgi:hypothetical protein